jgi:hypothetical protein
MTKFSQRREATRADCKAAEQDRALGAFELDNVTGSGAEWPPPPSRLN